jgi:2-polyprenyl-3-methyl-5-hydroxy-6-metoxy-1,4-benzoquinol methylase
MKISSSINCSMPQYWENSYRSGEMGWDLGGPTPIFNDWINSQEESLSICILGAGNGWDAINFSEKGHHCTAVDFAESAIKNMHSYSHAKGVQVNIVHSDIFDLEKIFHHTFDIVLEYTCYCAINPDRRNDYVRMASKILKSEGKVVAILYPVGKVVNDDGPPKSHPISPDL